MSNHTPGPWKLEAGRSFQTQGGNFFLSYGKDRYGNPNWTASFCELDANAALIAAAPELLTALTDLLNQLNGIGIPDWHGAEGLSLEQAREAIAKAEGAE